MIELKKQENALYKCQDFELRNNDNIFLMSLGGNGDLYWHLMGQVSEVSFPYVLFDFLITKEDYALYEKFYDLYFRLRYFRSKITDFELESRSCSTVGEYERLVADEKRLFEEAQAELLVDEVIIWYSEDCIKNEVWDAHFPPSWLMIKPVDEGILLQFKKKVKDFRSSNNGSNVSIRFCNDGCRYRDFNGPFMELYNELQEYSDEYHQMHIEEYLYLTRRKK